MTEKINEIDAYHAFTKRKYAILGILFILVLFLSVLSVNAGAMNLNLIEVFKSIIGYGTEISSVVIWRIRMPRVITAVVAGAGLVGRRDVLMQNNLRNPLGLAHYYFRNVSNAAAFGANVAIILFGAGSVQSISADAVIINNPYIVTLTAFVCAMGATLIIIGLSKLRGFTPASIVLAGVALGSLFTAGNDSYSIFCAGCSNSRCGFLDVR